MGAARRGGGSAWVLGMFAPAILYGLLAWRIGTVRDGWEAAVGVGCALLAYCGHVQIGSWARHRARARGVPHEAATDRANPADPSPTNAARPLLGWIAVTVAAVIAIVVILGRAR